MPEYESPKYLHPYYWDPQEGPLISGSPHSGRKGLSDEGLTQHSPLGIARVPLEIYAIWRMFIWIPWDCLRLLRFGKGSGPGSHESRGKYARPESVSKMGQARGLGFRV